MTQSEDIVKNDMTSLNALQTFPIGFFYTVIFLSFLPFVLITLGLDADLSEVRRIDTQVLEGSKAGLSELNMVSHSVHILLEWSSVITAFLAMVLAFSHYAINRNLIVPIIGLMFLSCATMDGFHTIASMRLVPVMGDIENVIPFSWFVARLFYAAILITGSLVCLVIPIEKSLGGRREFVGLAVCFGMASAGVIYWIIGNPALPRTVFEESTLGHPYDIVPLILFILAAPVLTMLYRKYPSFVTASLLITLVPNIVLQTHMAFGSRKLFDDHDMVAHILKLLSYFVPFFGFTFDFVQSRRKQIRNEIKLRSVLESIPEGFITTDANGVIEGFNRSAEHIFGRSAEEVIGSNAKRLLSGEHHVEFENYLRDAGSGRFKHNRSEPMEINGLRADGQVFPTELTLSRMRIGNRLLHNALARDITKRKTSLEKLERTLTELKLSNQDLEQFAYIASHDLKSPLRAIDNLSTWLAEDLEGKLDASSQDHIDKLRNRVKRMENLLQSLLEYSRVGQKISPSEDVNVHALCHEIIGQLNTPDNFTINLDGGLDEVMLPREPLEQIFHHLISNAIRHNEKPDGRLDVSVTVRESEYIFSFKDDGPGIPEQYHEQIFEIFQTLKRRDEVEGSGMGLAVVKKILQRIGGRYELRSREGEGAEILIYWPKSPVKNDTPIDFVR